MQATAHSGILAPIGRPTGVDLIYLLPLGDWKAFEAALLSMASRFIGRVRLIRAGRAKLGRFTSARVFLSNTVPNIIVLAEARSLRTRLGPFP